MTPAEFASCGFPGASEQPSPAVASVFVDPVATPTHGTEDPTALDETLRREFALARARIDEVAARRRELEVQLDAAREAERAALHTLSALETIGRQAGMDLPSKPTADPVADDGHERLAGVALREMIARVALRRRVTGQPVHWRAWLGWLREDGYDAAGKSPEATFQTQLARSPLVVRTDQDGVYRLEPEQLTRQRTRLGELHRQLSMLPAPDQLALLGDVRAQRQELQTLVARTERSLEEIWRVLAQEPPPDWDDAAEAEPERLVDAWMAG